MPDRLRQHQPGTRFEYAPRRQHRVAHTSPWSSSPTTIYTINIVASSPSSPTVVNVNANKSSTSPTSDTALLQAENLGLIPDIFYHYNSITINRIIFVHHDFAARVAV
jgi:hypothetical protein